MSGGASELDDDNGANEAHEAPRRARIDLDLTPLRHRAFRNLWIGRTVSNLGGVIVTVAVPYQMYSPAGPADFYSGVLRTMMLIRGTPDPLSGRLSGVEFAQVASAANLGHLEARVAAALVSLRVAVVSGGILCAAGGVATALLLPGFRRDDADRPLE